MPDQRNDGGHVLCPACGHDVELHNDAGSTPVGNLGPIPEGFILAGQMCCYARPNDGQRGLGNWGSRVCGCSNTPVGSTRWYR